MCMKVHREYYGEKLIQFGVVFYDVPLTRANTTHATNEGQEIVTTSTVLREQQVC